MLAENNKSAILLQGSADDQSFDRLEQRREKDVVVLEGRPYLKTARQSSKELLKRKITPTIMADNMAGYLFYKNMVKEVWIAYQIADINGALCDIGALIVAVLGKKHNIPVFAYPAGRKLGFIAKEKEIFHFNGERTAPRGVKGYVPLMEWVPSKYITKTYE